LQTEQGGSFVFADIAQVVRASAAKRHPFGVGVFLDVYFVIRIVRIVFHPKLYVAHEFVVLYELNKSHAVYLFTPSNYFIRSVVVDMFNDMR
jgi:hypothetical protein